MNQRSLTSREHPEEGIPFRPGVEGINQKSLTSREQPYEGINEKLLTSRYEPEEGINERSLTSRYAPEEGSNHWKGATIGRKSPSTIDTKEATFSRRREGSTLLPVIPGSAPGAIETKEATCRLQEREVVCRGHTHVLVVLPCQRSWCAPCHQRWCVPCHRLQGINPWWENACST